jgi:hypothetical protein
MKSRRVEGRLSLSPAEVKWESSREERKKMKGRFLALVALVAVLATAAIGATMAQAGYLGAKRASWVNCTRSGWGQHTGYATCRGWGHWRLTVQCYYWGANSAGWITQYGGAITSSATCPWWSYVTNVYVEQN